MRGRFAAILLSLSILGCGKDDGATQVQPNLNPPSNLVATRIGLKAVRLTWTDNSNSEADFWVERRSGTNAFFPKLFVVDNVTSVVDSSNLYIDTVYSYRVRAARYTEFGDYSDTASITLTLPYPLIAADRE